MGTEMTAVLLGSNDNQGFYGANQRTYRVTPPIDGHTVVVVSAVTLPGGFFGERGGGETYIFPGDEAGIITDFGELSGSQKGTLDHEAVLADLGYTIATEASRD